MSHNSYRASPATNMDQDTLVMGLNQYQEGPGFYESENMWPCTHLCGMNSGNGHWWRPPPCVTLWHFVTIGPVVTGAMWCHDVTLLTISHINISYHITISPKSHSFMGRLLTVTECHRVPQSQATFCNMMIRREELNCVNFIVRPNVAFLLSQGQQTQSLSPGPGSGEHPSY